VNADPIARFYRWLEYLAFGRALERCRFQFLDEVKGSRSALLLGEGDGRFLERLSRIAPDASIEIVDNSSAMLRLAYERSKGARVTFRHEDARKCALAHAQFDLIVTHFFLDCFAREEMAALVNRLGDAAAPRSIWLVSEFRQPTRWTRWIVRVLYWFFGWAAGLEVKELADHRPALLACGFELREERLSLGGLLAAEFWVRR
jgi:ubiquinone/menaquinone biosynthesis C-methylase UbiE